MIMIKIKTENDAFSDSAEIERVICIAGKEIANGEIEGKLFDYNGNSVGFFKVTK